jgi:hypothetical protein
MNGIVILFMAGLTAFAFIVVVLRRRQTSRPLRGMLLLVATAIVAYIGWIFVTTVIK